MHTAKSQEKSMVLTEQVDYRLVHYLIATFDRQFQDCDSDTRKSILSKLKEIRGVMDESGSYPVEYAHHQSFGGRQYGRGGVQSMRSSLRGVLYHGRTDCDMANAQPRICAHLCNLHGLPVPTLNRYIKDRETVLREISQNRADAKCAVITLMNGGRVTGDAPVLKKLEAEFRAFRSKLPAWFPDIAATLKGQRGPNDDNYAFLRSLTHHVLGYHEDRALQTMMRVASERGETVRVAMFDGLVMDTVQDQVKLFAAMEAAVLAEHGFIVKLVSKPIDSGYTLPSEDTLNNFTPAAIERRDVESVLPEYTLGPRVNGMYGIDTDTCIINSCETPSCSVYVHKNGNIMGACACDASLTRVLGNVKSEVEKAVDWGPNVAIRESDAAWVAKHVDFGKYNIHLILAAMGKGKTTMMVITVASMVKQDKRTLIIPVRVTLGYGVKTELEEKGISVQHYMDPDFDGKGQVVICSFESLHRLPDNSKFDLIVLDEIASLCNTMVSVNTNKEKLDENFQRLKAWVTETESARGHQPHVLCMDAGLESDARVADLFRDWFPRDKLVQDVCLTRYTRVRESMRREFVLTSRAEMYNDMLLHSDETCGFVSRSKRCVDEWEVIMIDNNAEHNVMSFTSKTSDDVRRDIWSNPTEKLKDVDHIGITSCVQAGCDVNTPFDRLYIDASSRGGCTAADILQMNGRFRGLKNPRVLVATSGKDVPSVRWTDRLNQCLGAIRTRRDTLRKWSFSLHPSPDGLLFAPSDMTRMRAYADAECLDFNANLYRLAIQRGYRVYYQTELKDITKHAKEFMESVETRVAYDTGCAITSALDILNADGADSAVDMADARMKAGAASEEDKVLLDVHYKTKHHQSVLADFTADDVKAIGTYGGAIKRHAALNRVLNPHVVDQVPVGTKCADIRFTSMGLAPFVDAMQCLTGSSATGHELVAAVDGLKFSEDSLNQRVWSNITATNSLVGGRARGGGMTQVKHAFKNFGFTVESDRKRVGGGKRKREYTVGVDEGCAKYAKMSNHWAVYAPPPMVSKPTEAPALNPYEKYLAKLAAANSS